ncbi:coiled-coil domain-containing protein [Spongorhabdus nitratireducens]
MWMCIYQYIVLLCVLFITLPARVSAVTLYTVEVDREESIETAGYNFLITEQSQSPPSTLSGKIYLSKKRTPKAIWIEQFTPADSGLRVLQDLNGKMEKSVTVSPQKIDWSDRWNGPVRGINKVRYNLEISDDIALSSAWCDVVTYVAFLFPSLAKENPFKWPAKDTRDFILPAVIMSKDHAPERPSFDTTRRRKRRVTVLLEDSEDDQEYTDASESHSKTIYCSICRATCTEMEAVPVVIDFRSSETNTTPIVLDSEVSSPSTSKKAKKEKQLTCLKCGNSYPESDQRTHQQTCPQQSKKQRRGKKDTGNTSSSTRSSRTPSANTSVSPFSIRRDAIHKSLEEFKGVLDQQCLDFEQQLSQLKKDQLSFSKEKQSFKEKQKEHDRKEAELLREKQEFEEEKTGFRAELTRLMSQESELNQEKLHHAETQRHLEKVTAELSTLRDTLCNLGKSSSEKSGVPLPVLTPLSQPTPPAHHLTLPRPTPSSPFIPIPATMESSMALSMPTSTTHTTTTPPTALPPPQQFAVMAASANQSSNASRLTFPAPGMMWLQSSSSRNAVIIPSSALSGFQQLPANILQMPPSIPFSFPVAQTSPQQANNSSRSGTPTQ